MQHEAAAVANIMLSSHKTELNASKFITWSFKTGRFVLSVIYLLKVHLILPVGGLVLSTKEGINGSG